MTTSTSVTTSLATVGKENATSSTGKTWAIVGGSVGGAVVLAGLIFIVLRCRHKRFSDNDGEDLRWPELQPQGQTVSAQASTLNPLGTRPTGRAGVEMSEAPDYAESFRGRRESESLSSFEGYPERSMSGAAGGGYRHDPFLGASAAPYPAPPRIYPNLTRQHSPSNSSGGHYTNAYAGYPAPAQPVRTGTPLQTHIPLGGVSLGRNASFPPVGQLRARNA